MRLRSPRPLEIIILISAILVVGRYLQLPISVAVVAGPSMVPTLQPGDIVFLGTFPYDIGDVIMWCNNQLNCVLHRLVEIEGDAVITKGDANPLPDPPVSREMVRYKLLFSLPSYIWIPLYLGILGVSYWYEKKRFS